MGRVSQIIQVCLKIEEAFLNEFRIRCNYGRKTHRDAMLLPLKVEERGL